MPFTARLHGGSQGPQTTIEEDDIDRAAQEAYDWSEAQIGHPYHELTITDEDTGEGYTVTSFEGKARAEKFE